MTKAILGDKQLARALNTLDRKASKKALVAGIRASLTPVKKAMRSQINGTPKPSTYDGKTWANVKREARRAIGARLETVNRRISASRVTKKIVGAKAGFKVGMKKKQAAAAISKGRKAKHGSRGRGVSVANIHWFVLGTDKRTTDAGHPTGKMEAAFGDVIAKAFRRSQSTAVAAASSKIRDVINKEAAKARKS